MDIARIDASLEDQILDEPTDGIIRKGSDHRGPHPKTSPQTTGDIVLAPAFPDLKVASRVHSSLAWIEPQHDLPEGDRVPATGRLRLDCQHTHRSSTLIDRSSAEECRNGLHL